MPHEYAKHHNTSDGAKLVNTPSELIDLMIPGPNERQAAIAEIENEGPVYRQVFSALLFNRLNKMVHLIEKNSAIEFKLQEGYELTKEKEGIDEVLFVDLPVHLGTDLQRKQIANTLSEAPEHEALMYAMCLQVIEWSIKTLENN